MATAAPRKFAPAFGSKTNVVDHGLKEAMVTLSIPIKDGKGNGILCPDTLASTVGVANPDFANIHAATITNITHNLGDDVAIVANLKHGDDTPIEGAPKHHVVVTDANTKKPTHMLSGAVVAVGTSTNHNKRIEIMPEATTQEAADTMQMSAAKWLRWGAEADQLRKAGGDKKFINHDVRVAELGSSTPGEPPAVKVLVPHEPNDNNSVFTKYFQMMRNTPDFHDGAYADDCVNTVKLPNDDGVAITYATMEKGDYDATLPSLTDKLMPHSEMEKKGGLLTKLVAGSPVNGTAHVQVTLHRTPATTVLHNDLVSSSLAEEEKELPHLLEEHIDTAFGTGESVAPLADSTNAQMTSIFGEESTTGNLVIKSAADSTESA
jgi:hypothetical protein